MPDIVQGAADGLEQLVEKPHAMVQLFLAGDTLRFGDTLPKLGHCLLQLQLGALDIAPHVPQGGLDLLNHFKGEVQDLPVYLGPALHGGLEACLGCQVKSVNEADASVLLACLGFVLGEEKLAVFRESQAELGHRRNRQREPMSRVMESHRIPFVGRPVLCHQQYGILQERLDLFLL